MPIAWDLDDASSAADEGWAICSAYGSARHDPTRENLELAALNEMGLYEEGDLGVWKFVAERALAGSMLHCKALAYIKQEDEREVREIVKALPYARQAFDFAVQLV